MRGANLDGWPWLGAPLAIDLANTVVLIRPGEVLDLLDGEDELDDWLSHERGRLPAPPRRSHRLGAFHELRNAVRAVLSAVQDGIPLPRAAVATINQASARSPGTLALRIGGSGASAHHRGTGTALERALATIARSAIELLAGPDAGRLRTCAAPSCGMLYLTRPGQRWCSTVCGNRVRAARHYRRRRTVS